MQPRHDQQRDLFKGDRMLMEFPSALRRELVRLIECLLNEAVAGYPTQTLSDGLGAKGAAHEQDHT